MAYGHKPWQNNRIFNVAIWVKVTENNVTHLFRHDKEGTNDVHNGIIWENPSDKAWPKAAWEVRHE